jgi:hypothetical protein
MSGMSPFSVFCFLFSVSVFCFCFLFHTVIWRLRRNPAWGSSIGSREHLAHSSKMDADGTALIIRDIE